MRQIGDGGGTFVGDYSSEGVESWEGDGPVARWLDVMPFGGSQVYEFGGSSVFGRIDSTGDGAVVGSVDLSGSAQTLLGSSAQFHLGDNGNAFRGMVDELRIERRTRSTDFARAQYLNATRQFVTFTDP